MRFLIAGLMMLVGSAMASPTLYTGSVKMEADDWRGDFSRAQGLIPLDAEILSSRRDGNTVVVHFAFDPDQEYVWRRVIMTRGIAPVVVPLDRFINERGGVYFWDEGQFSQPLREVAAD